LVKKKAPLEMRAIKLVPLEITVRNKVPSENIPVGTSFLTVMSREKYFIEN
jgi:hypothetical protein